MANVNPDLPIVNALFGNYPTQEGFFQDLPNIASKFLVNFLEQINPNAWNVSSRLVDRVVTQLITNATQGKLTLALARRVSATMQTSFTYINNNKNDNNIPIPFNDLIEVHCQTMDEPIKVSKIFLVSSSPILQKMFNQEFKGKRESKINLPSIPKETLMHLKEFLETGEVDLLEKSLFSPEQLQNLFGLAQYWQMTELLDYLSAFINIDAASFDDIFKSAIDAKAIGLFKECLKSKFNSRDYEIKIKDWDDFTVEISDLTPEAEEKLGEMCHFLAPATRDKVLPPIKHFEILPKGRFAKPKLSYPQSLKRIVTDINFFLCNLSPSIEEIINVTKHCENLQGLTLPAIYYAEEMKGINQLAETCKRACKKFTSLELYFHSRIKKEDIKTLESFPQLRELVTNVNFKDSEITDSELQFLTKECPNLKVIHLSLCHKISDEGLKAIGENCPHLQRLNVFQCNKINGSGFQFLAQGCPGLTSLKISGSKNIMDDHLETLTKGCAKLEEFCYDTFSSKITDKGFKALLMNCPDLRVLQMTGNITSEGFQTLIKKGKKLVSFSFADLYGKVTKEELKLLLLSCPNLLDLNLWRCDNITDDALKVIARECSTLQWLKLCCDLVTDAGLLALVKGCKKLRYLSVGGCSHTSQGIRDLKTKYPKIRIDDSFGHF